MALQTSGAISLANLATEFGDSTPYSMSEFYRGGSLVPDSSANSSVPTSGAISLGNFYGAQNSLYSTSMTAGADSYNLYLYGDVAYVGYQVAEGSFGQIGSVTDNTVDFLSGATLKSIVQQEYDPVISGASMMFQVAGVVSNTTNWTSMTISSIGTFNRTSATFNNFNSNSQWRWAYSAQGMSGGSTYTVTFQ